MKKICLNIKIKTWTLLVLAFVFAIQAKAWEPGPNCHLIDNSTVDGLHDFVEGEYGTSWTDGDTIMLTEEGTYTVSNVIDIYGECVIMGDPRLDTRPVLLLQDDGFRFKEDSINFELRNLDVDGYDPEDSEITAYLLNFNQSSYYNYKNIIVENVDITHMKGAIYLFKYKFCEYDTVLINNVVFDSITVETAIETRQNKIGYLSVTNCTFTDVVKGILGEFVDSVENLDAYYPKTVLFEHNTVYNSVENNVLAVQNIRDNSMNVTIQNNIFSELRDKSDSYPFRIVESSGDISIKNNVFHNFSTSTAYDVDSVAYLPNVTVLNVNKDDPEFADIESSDLDLTIPLTSDLMTFGTDGKSVGDPRWVTPTYIPSDNVHLIYNDKADTLENFIENYYGTIWNDGDTIMLADEGTYIINGTIDIYGECVITSDPRLDSKPTLAFYDNGFRPAEDSINIELKGFNADGLEPGVGLAGYFFYSDQTDVYNYKNIIVDDIEIKRFGEGLKLSDIGGTGYDTLIINNVIFDSISSIAINPNQNQVAYLSVTNSTFMDVAKGIIGEYSDTGNVYSGSEMIIDKHIVFEHNTVYNSIGSDEGSFMNFDNIADGLMQVEVKNNIFSKLYSPSEARTFRLNDTCGTVTIENNVFHNFKSERTDGWWDADSVDQYTSVTTTGLDTNNPGFISTAYPYDLTLPDTSYLLTAATDDTIMGDPRWYTNSYISIDIPTESLVNGDSLQLTCEVVVDGEDKTVLWTVENGTGSATIDESTGLIVGTATGTVTVKAASSYNENIFDKIELTVQEKNFVTNITVVGENKSGYESDKITNESGYLDLTATIAPGNATDRSLVWSWASDDGGRVTLNTFTNTTAKIIAVQCGTVTISAAAQDGSGKVGTLVVTITNQTPVQSFEVTTVGNITTLNAGDSVQMMLTNVLPDTACDITGTYYLDETSGDDVYVSVSESGMVKGRNAGTATIYAYANGGDRYDIKEFELTVTGTSVSNTLLADIQVLPNPASSEIMINNNKTASITITNLLGAVMSSTIVEPKGTVDISSLPAGMYLVQVKIDNESTTIQMVKE